MEPSLNPYASPNLEAVPAAATSTTGSGAGFVSPQAKGRRAVVLFYAAMFFLLLELAYYGGIVFLVLRTEAGTPPNDTEARLLVYGEQALMVLHLLVRVGLLAAFLSWFRQAYRNLPALGEEDLRYSSGEAALSFFIPFLNFYRPYQLTKQVWRASDLSAVDPGQRVVFSSALVGYWWAFVWISIALGMAAWYTNREAGLGADNIVADEVIVAVWFSIGAVLMQMIAALLGLHVVKTITTNQEEKHRRLEWERQTLGA